MERWTEFSGLWELTKLASIISVSRMKKSKTWKDSGKCGHNCTVSLVDVARKLTKLDYVLLNVESTITVCMVCVSWAKKLGGWAACWEMWNHCI
jgi:hypothetical protein